jgi:hypothetical protein
MRLHRLSLRALFGALSISLVLASNALAGGRIFVGTMTGAAERPGPGDPDGSGTFRLELNQGQGTICFSLSVSNIALPTTGNLPAHIHEAPATDPGPVVVPLIGPDSTGTSSGCVSVSEDEIKEIRHDPDEYYVNVHNSEFPDGAVRAQLSK